MEYITCVIGGDKTQCNVRRDRVYDVLTAPITLDWMAFTLALLSSIVNLNYILNYSDVKEAIVHLLQSLKR